MPYSLNLYALIPLLALLQGFLFASLLILRGRREERYSDYWLALALVLLSINGVPYMFGWLGIELLWTQFTYLPWDGFWLAIPPTLYLFLKSLTNDRWRFSVRRDAGHYWVYGLYFIEHLIVGIVGWQNRSFIDGWVDLPFNDLGHSVMSWGIEFYYFYLSYRLYQQYRQWTFNEFSNPDRVSFMWFRNYLIVKFVLTAIGILNNIYISLSPEQGNAFYALMWWGYLTDTVLIYYLSITGYTQSRVHVIQFSAEIIENQSFVAQDLSDTEGVLSIKNLELKIKTDSTEALDDVLNDDIELDFTKNEPTQIPIQTNSEAILKLKNTLSETDLALWKKKVLMLFEKDMPYLNPELTLSDLAVRLKTNTSILSQVINTGFGKNFNDFVNEYRVAAFKAKINTPPYQHFTMLGVAFDCGFNSKTTFNRAFKKITNQNPSDYQTREIYGSSPES